MYSIWMQKTITSKSMEWVDGVRPPKPNIKPLGQGGKI